MRKLPKPGDRVIVYAGGREVEGVVTYVTPNFDPPEAQVEYPVDEEDPTATARNKYSIDRIRPVPAHTA